MQTVALERRENAYEAIVEQLLPDDLVDDAALTTEATVVPTGGSSNNATVSSFVSINKTQE